MRKPDELRATLLRVNDILGMTRREMQVEAYRLDFGSVISFLLSHLDSLADEAGAFLDSLEGGT